MNLRITEAREYLYKKNTLLSKSEKRKIIEYKKSRINGVNRAELRAYEYLMSLEELIKNSQSENYERTYAKPVRHYLREELEESDSILILGGGIPKRFPEESYEKSTIVDLSEKICNMWREKGAKRVLEENITGFNTNKLYDAVVLPAVLDWVKQFRTGDLENLLKKVPKFMQERGKIILFDTVHKNTPYYEFTNEEYTERKRVEDWHEHVSHKKPLTEYFLIMGLEEGNVEEEVICSKNNPWVVKQPLKTNFITPPRFGEEWTVHAVKYERIKNEKS